MALLFRILDKGFSLSQYTTKMRTIQQYINLYSGPEYLIHFKYSRTLNIVFVAFMYGLTLPWIFPIWLVSLIIDYIVEKLCIVYYYKDPPSYDNKLNLTAISIMKWAPLLMFATNFWMFSNREIFENYAELNPQARPKVETTGHVLFQGVTNTPAFSLFVVFWILLVGLIFEKLISKVLQMTPFLIKIEEHIDENLRPRIEKASKS